MSGSTTDDQPPPTPTATPDMLAQALQLAQQSGLMPQMPARDTTPVSRSTISLLGEALAGGPPVPGMTPTEQEAAGRHALMSFGTSLMGASGVHPGVGLSARLAQGFQGAQAGETGYEQMSLAQLGAQQGWAQQQAQNRVEAIKAALPFLRLQAAQGIPNPLAGNAPAGPNTSISAAANGTYESTINNHEGAGKDPNSSAVGGFLSGTWNDFAAANPDLFKGMSPAQILAARSNSALRDQATSWLARQNAGTLSGAGVTPSGQSLGIAHYLGAGPAAKVMAAPDNAPVSSFVSDAAVKANPELGKMTVGQLKQRYAGVPDPGFLAPPGQPAPYKVATAGPIPPPPSAASTAPASTTLPVPPIPPAPSTGVVSAGELPGAGAGTAGPPASTTTPPAQPAPQSTTQAQQPPTPPPVTTPPAPPLASMRDQDLNPEQYIQKHWTPLTPEEVARYAPGPEGQLAVDRSRAVQQAQADADTARQTYTNAVKAAQMGVTGFGDVNKSLTEMNAADARLDAAEKDYNTAVQGLKTEGAKNLLAADDQQRQRLAAQYKAAVTDPANAAALETLKNKQAIDLENVKAGVATSQKLQEAYNTDAANSGKRIDDLELLRGLSDNAGSPTLLTSIKVGDRSLADIISATGFGGKDLQDKVGAIQAFRAGILNTVRELRTGGAATGEPRSNQDLQFVQDMAPNEWQSPATRGAIISFLQQVNQRRIDMAAEVSRLMATRGPGGQLMPAGEAVAQARQNLPDFVPTMPKGSDASTPEALATRKLFFNGVQPHTFFRYPNGRIDLYNGPPGG